ncbi:hypothetical protein ACJIZ3_019871 [Penstemon smallii]|uniref:Cation efflux protein transmembrane domain-containing protein n=1 Tax=Penstemon smallii TaxID=265156 RepID=A0ABD3T2E0_9LAMI
MNNFSCFPRTKNQNAAFDYQKLADSPGSYTGDFVFEESTDRRFEFSREASFHENGASVSSIDIPSDSYFTDSSVGYIMGCLDCLVSDAFHLTFGCGLLSFSLFAMAASRQKPDGTYTYGLEVLSAFTNALSLLFMLFFLAVEALHAFIQDESKHKHYLIVSAVTKLLVNLIGVWFFRNYARITLVYRNAEDMNYHSVYLHILADSIRSAGLILLSWLLTLGHNFYACDALFKATGGVFLQTAPPNIPSSVNLREVKAEVSEARFWELVSGHVKDIFGKKLEKSNHKQEPKEREQIDSIKALDNY